MGKVFRDLEELVNNYHINLCKNKGVDSTYLTRRRIDRMLQNPDVCTLLMLRLRCPEAALASK